MSISYIIFKVKRHYFAVAKNSRGVCRIVIYSKTAKKALQEISSRASGEAVNESGKLSPEAGNIEKILTQKKKGFNFPLDLTGGTEFERKIWRAAASIKYGQTRSYKWLAKKAGRANAWRAAGRALSRNPLPLAIPCHRVIKSCGQIGGFSGGPKIKKKLLINEGGSF
jgi:methylated-DNA-[protein]-cysteine S-methyltransferase